MTQNEPQTSTNKLPALGEELHGQPPTENLSPPIPQGQGQASASKLAQRLALHIVPGRRPLFRG